MENFVEPFLENGIVYSLNNALSNGDINEESNIIKFLQKIIFKHDVLVEFKKMLNSACSPDLYTVENDTVKKLIKRLIELLRSEEDIKIKIDVFCFIFQSFSSKCKENDSISVLQFFLVLTYILGVTKMPQVYFNKDEENCHFLINEENFKNAFEVDDSTFSPEYSSVLKELFLCLWKTNINLNATEIQPYTKCLQQLIKNLAYFKPFQTIFMEIFSISAEIDLKLLEGNLDNIFCNILNQTLPLGDNFCDLYTIFLEKTLKICAKFQRTVKFMSMFLRSIKVTSTVLSKEIILPSNFINEFSKIVHAASNQQCHSLLEVLVQNIKECFWFIAQNNSGSELLLLFISSELLVNFLKEVKLYAPSIALTTLLAFINKIKTLKEVLEIFGGFLFNNKSFILKNEDILKIYLELCFYCTEIQILINCFKDSILQPQELINPNSDCDQLGCLSLVQWKKLVNIVLKSRVETCGPICFQLALQELRANKLAEKTLPFEDSILKIIMYHLTSDFTKFNIFQQVLPGDFVLIMDVLTITQSKTIVKNIFNQIIKSGSRVESADWLASSAIQNNSVIILSLLSEILKKTGYLLQNSVIDKSNSKISWFLDEYFDDRNCICTEILESLPEKINILLRNSKKIRKSISKNLELADSLAKIIDIFKLLPFPYIKSDARRLAFIFAVGVGALLPDNENIVCWTLECVCIFLFSDTDASTCFDIGLYIKWLSDFSHENKNVNDLKAKVIEILVRYSPIMKFGLSQMGEIIHSAEMLKSTNPLKILETRVALYNELGKCWQRAKKRKSDNDLIGSYRCKLAKVISDEARQLQYSNLDSENGKILLEVFVIELNKSAKLNDENEISNLAVQKLPSYFDFAVKKLKKNFDEASATFLTVLLQLMPKLRNFIPQNSLLKIWKTLKTYEKVNWRLFCINSSDEEFIQILDDLLKISKESLSSEEPDRHSSNCFDVWTSFFEFTTGSKKNQCQLRLQEFFNYIHDYYLLLRNMPITKKIYLIKFFSFITNKKVILTSHMLDTIIHTILECLDDSCPIEDFNSMFTVKVEVLSAILLKHFALNRSKVHLTFVIFKHMLNSLIARIGVSHQIDKDDVIKISNCAFCLEKWTSLLVKREKDFARTSAYFITTLISSIASVTVLPPIKIHLINCINHFLSISDAYTVAYLMRTLKPGYQQVFSTVYNQFKKYHKYSGKI